MKSLQFYLNEGHTSTYDKQEYMDNPKHEIYKQYALDYLSVLNSDGQLYTCIKEAINSTNDVFDVFYSNGISGFLNGQMVGRIIETNLADQMKSINGFAYSQGQENSSEKDINCTVMPEDFDIDGIESLPYNYGIELKCSKGKGITGNKSYAKDINGRKDKASFYILINYEWPTDLPENNEDVTQADLLNEYKFNIKSYTAYFCYLDKDDWWYGDKGNAASLKMGVLKQKRLLEIKPVV